MSSKIEKNEEVQRESNEVKSALRRRVIMWTPPAIGVMVLPVHAQTTECPVPPRVNVETDPKCNTSNTGDIVGQASLQLLSSSDDIQVVSITHNGGDKITLSATSGTITSSSGIDIEWNGSSAAEMPCLPEEDVSFTVIYTCNGSGETEYMFSLLEQLT